MEELLSLKWNNHCSTFLQVLTNIRSKYQFSDVTLICEDKCYSVHQMVLSACSDYFKGMFEKLGHHEKLVIALTDVKSEHFDLLLDYMYLGEVNVKQCDLTSLIKTSEILQIKGLAVADENPTDTAGHSSYKRKLDSPAAKRKRKPKKTDACEISSRPDTYRKTETLPIYATDQNNDAPFPFGVNKLEEYPVKDEPQEDFVEEIFSNREVKHDTLSSETVREEGNKDNSDYQPQLPDPQMEDSWDMEDSNFSSSSIQDQQTTWEGSDTGLSLEPPDLPVMAESSSQPAGSICYWCSKRFPCKAALQMHIRIHTGEKPFVCRHCSYRSAQKSTLQYHTFRRHGVGRL